MPEERRGVGEIAVQMRPQLRTSNLIGGDASNAIPDLYQWAHYQLVQL